MSDSTKAYFILSDGTVFEGNALGSTGVTVGESVFATGMNGYIETLTDPSYYGQIVSQTFPLIGNYGIIPQDFESSSCYLKGYIVESACDFPSNFRNGGTLDAFLKEKNIIGISGIDTRLLTLSLREAGVMNGIVISGDSMEAHDALAEYKNNPASFFKKLKDYSIKDAVKNVTGASRGIEKDAETVFAESASYGSLPLKSDGNKEYDMAESMKRGRGKKVVLWDFGAKANIRRELLKRGLEVTTMGAFSSAGDILAQNPDGVMLSNGPGDPAENVSIIQEIKKLAESDVPLFGICLGHQMLALSFGAKTKKMRYGHRGVNQPVKQLSTGRVYMTSQNHGYEVDLSSLPEGVEASFINPNDKTCEGLAYKGRKAFSVQFHPEACGGPLDTNFLFDDFIRNL